MAGLRAAFGADLDLVAPAQVDAAVAMLGAQHLDVQFEVLERARRADVGAARFVEQRAVLDDPVAVRRDC